MTTKEKIIETAAAIFGRQGFKAATIRKIASAAEVNIAAINYHFGDKEGLYREVLQAIFAKGFERFPAVPGPNEDQDPEHRLHVFIRAFLHRFLSDDGWQEGKGRLVAKEFLDPTPAFEDIVQTYIKPHKDILVSIISDLSGGITDMNALLPCAFSIIGQCIYYAYASPIITRIAPGLLPVREHLDFLVDHVCKFSLAGIQAVTRPPQGQDKNVHLHQESPS